MIYYENEKLVTHRRLGPPIPTLIWGNAAKDCTAHKEGAWSTEHTVGLLILPQENFSFVLRKVKKIKVIKG